MHSLQHESYAKFRFPIDIVATEVYVQEIIYSKPRGSSCGLREVPRIRGTFHVPAVHPLNSHSLSCSQAPGRDVTTMRAESEEQ